MIKKHLGLRDYITLYQISLVKWIQMADEEMIEACEAQHHIEVS